MKITIEIIEEKPFIPRIKNRGGWFWYTANRLQFIGRDYDNFSYPKW